jgi:anaerobic ribonucleoside-triphosphate reductase activating protein
MKYLDYAITFSEFPDEIALCINISNCPHHCEGCHSPELWKDTGNILNKSSLSKLIESNKGI